MMDNRQFNVNGYGRDMLLAALQLVCTQAGGEKSPTRIYGWMTTPEFGMMLFKYPGHGVPLPGHGLLAEEAIPFLMSWLNSVDLAEIKLDGWDVNKEHDGSNVVGWRIFCEDWGHVGNESAAFCAVKPVYLWHGK